ncbi:hypothetical protein [Sphingomonas oryzagri]
MIDDAIFLYEHGDIVVIVGRDVHAFCGFSRAVDDRWFRHSRMLTVR